MIIRNGTPLVSHASTLTGNQNVLIPKFYIFGFQPKWKDLLTRGVPALIIIISIIIRVSPKNSINNNNNNNNNKNNNCLYLTRMTYLANIQISYLKSQISQEHEIHIAQSYIHVKYKIKMSGRSKHCMRRYDKYIQFK